MSSDTVYVFARLQLGLLVGASFAYKACNACCPRVLLNGGAHYQSEPSQPPHQPTIISYLKDGMNEALDLLRLSGGFSARWPVCTRRSAPASNDNDR